MRPEYRAQGSWFLLNGNVHLTGPSLFVNFWWKNKSVCFNILHICLIYLRVTISYSRNSNYPWKERFMTMYTGSRSHGEGHWGDSKNWHKKIYASIGWTCPVVYWCGRDVFWIKRNNFGKITFFFYLFKKFRYFSDILCIYGKIFSL